MQRELLFVEGVAQPAGQVELPRGRSVHRLGVELEVVPVMALRVVHRRVGVAHQRLEVLAVRGIDGDADAGRREELVVAHRNRPGEFVQHALSDLGGILARSEPREQHGELVAAQPRHLALRLTLRPPDVVAEP